MTFSYNPFTQKIDEATQTATLKKEVLPIWPYADMEEWRLANPEQAAKLTWSDAWVPVKEEATTDFLKAFEKSTPSEASQEALVPTKANISIGKENTSEQILHNQKPSSFNSSEFLGLALTLIFYIFLFKVGKFLWLKYYKYFKPIISSLEKFLASLESLLGFCFKVVLIIGVPILILAILGLLIYGSYHLIIEYPIPTAIIISGYMISRAVTSLHKK